jgi:hypothetical protein
MRIAITSSLLIIAGCAGQPSAPPAPAAPPTRIVSNAPVVATPASTTGTSSADATTKAVIDAKRRGYTVVNENGVTMYCHKDARTGSHLANETTCMTEKEMQDLREATQRGLQNFEMQMPPPQGK